MQGQVIDRKPQIAAPRAVQATRPSQIQRWSHRYTFRDVVREGGPLVHGRLDALYCDARGNFEVVEYKLTDEANDEMDRAQVALYRSLLRTAEATDATPVILRFTPTLRETTLTAESADALLERTVLPLLDNMVGWAASPEDAPATHRKDLCPACPVARSCAETFPERLPSRDDPPMAATRPRPGRSTAVIQDPAGFRPRRWGRRTRRARKRRRCCAIASSAS